ncbi:MAG TPA: glycoside hydrolase family 127 protein [Bryobacteraceae bacterium]|nr:glycoside hydrolase family 127 protein [Bryobacteraceae bacterium]
MAKGFKRMDRRRFAALLSSAGALAPSLFAQEAQHEPAGQKAPPPPQNKPPAGAPNPNTSLPRRGTLPEMPPFDPTITFTRSDVALKVQPFPMTQVRVLGGAYKQAEQWDLGYMDRLGEDRLVRNFQVNAGIPSSAKPLGGWETDVPGRAGELRGHFTGHYLSASALMYASTGDKDVKAKGDQMVADLAKCQQKLSGGYLSAFPTEWFDRLDARKPVWAPFYTIHKIMAGMIDQYQFAGNKQALEVVQGMAEWADNWTASKSEEHMQQILETEFGGMAESLYNLTAITNDDRWARAGDRFTKKRVFNPLAMQRDELRGLHVNTHIPQIIGAARRYEISGDMRFHDVASFFFYTVSTGRTYVTGGTSNGEGWEAQPRLLAAELKQNVATAECCCAYNMLKVARHLYSWTADPKLFDYYERLLMNHRIGTIHPESGHTQYYLSLTPGAWKTFNTEDNSFWCCTGTGVEEYSKLNDSIYWHDDRGVYVNLFMPSELNWTEKGFRLRQETTFPEQPSTTLHVTVNRPTQLAIRLRVPSWLTSSASVKLNGKPLDASAEPGSYLTISRVWKSGDRIEMSLPMTLRVEKMPDDQHMQAFLYGPLVLAGDLGDNGLTPQLLEGPNAPPMRRLPIDVPTFSAKSAEPASWIKPADTALSFRTTGQATDVSLVPLNSLFGKRYSVYWQVS